MKYMGSKSRIAKYIVPILQKYIDDNNILQYCEPFVGGCNIIDKIKCPNKQGSDINKYLIALLNHVKKDLPLYEEISRELYNKAREAYKNQALEFENWELGAIGFLASYNGRFFNGGYAQPTYEQTKSGLRYRDYYQESKRNILKQAPNLKDITITYQDYKDINLTNSLIYCDPPYNGTTGYNVKKFNHEEFWKTMRKWSDNNIVIISEINAPDDFECIWEKEVSRSIRTTNKSKATEKLFRYNKSI